MTKCQLHKFLYCHVCVVINSNSMSCKGLSSQHCIWQEGDLDLQQLVGQVGLSEESYSSVPASDPNNHMSKWLYMEPNRNIKLWPYILKPAPGDVLNFKHQTGFVVGKALDITPERISRRSLLDFTELFMEEWLWPGYIGFFSIETPTQCVISQPCGKRKLLNSEPGDFLIDFL